MGKVFDLNKFKSTEPDRPAARLDRKRTTEPFVMVPLRWIERAAPAVRAPAALVLVELLHTAWRVKSATFPLPNTKLSKLGITRKVKWRILRNLERGGLITIERRAGKTPRVTLNGF